MQAFSKAISLIHVGVSAVSSGSSTWRNGRDRLCFSEYFQHFKVKYCTFWTQGCYWLLQEGMLANQQAGDLFRGGANIAPYDEVHFSSRYHPLIPNLRFILIFTIFCSSLDPVA